jgi:tetratricopeptide (TPR) repeat protein
MGKPLDFSLYNTDQLEDRDFLAGFIARQEVVNKILARLGETKRRGLAQHRLIVGQRGMGKTSLLRRIALGVRDQPALAAVLLPLSFREEQYNVHNLHVFWCNCLDALGDWFEATGGRDKAERLDRDVAALNAQEDDEEGSKALELFRGWMKEEQRRPLLLLDNLDIIFAGLKNKQWSLRRVLQEAGGIVVIGASAAALEAAADREGAFYDFFQVDVLAKLEHHEILLCLRHMARQREEAGRRVLQILDCDPARIHVLYDLTGGNPRTLVMLYLVLETSGDESVMRDLERLLDQATPLYKARVEELAPQTRVVFDALALAWDPATAAHLAGVTGLEVSVVSAQLDRLFKEGVVEKTSLSSTNRTAFQVAERFFNIWYLMRHSPRRQRQRLRWLTEMLRRIYSPRELRERAMGLLGRVGAERFSSAAYCLALSDAVEDRGVRVALRGLVRRNSLFAVEGDVQLEDDLSLPNFASNPLHSAATTVANNTAAETYRRAIERNPNDADLWNGLGKLLIDLPESSVEAEAAFHRAIELAPKDAGPWTNLGILLAGPLKRHAEAEAAYRKAIELNPKDVRPWANLGTLLGWPLERHSEAEAAYRKAIELDPKDVRLWTNLGTLLGWLLERHAEAEAAYRKAIELDPKDVRPWTKLGNLLAGPLERYAEAEAVYRKAIELDPKDVWPWINLGNLLRWRLERHAEAEAAFHKAIEMDPKSAAPWISLGNLLAAVLKRYDEAEAAYRTAIALDSKEAGAEPWNNLGILLAGPLERHAEAEAAYRTAIELDPRGAWRPWTNLGKLLAGPLERYSEAEAAYRKAIELDPKVVWPWTNLGRLLAGPLERYAEAEAAYRKAIELDPKDKWPWNDLGSLLARPLKRYGEAEAAYRKAIEIDPKNAWPWNNLGYLLAGPLKRYGEAEAAYRKAIECDPKGVWPWTNLGNLLAGPLERHTEAEAAYRKTIEFDSKEAGPWINLGILLAGPLERYSEAEAAYRKAIELDPKDARPWNNLGALLTSSLERHGEAEAAYRKAIELDPKDAGPWNNLGNLLAGPLESHAEAEAAYRKAIELDPKKARPWNNLGNLLAGPLGRHAEAEVAYCKAIELDPKDAWPWTNLGDLLAGPLKRHAEAEAAFRKAIELDLKDAGSWISLGNLLADHLFRPDEAERAYGMAMRIDSQQDSSALVNLAYLLLRRDGRSADAETFYQLAIAATPPHGAGLLRAFYALAAENFGIATAELRSVLEEDHSELFTVFRIGLLRILQFAADRGDGDKLLVWLKSSGFSDRYWPLQVAFEAYLHGEDRLMDVNPEVRSGARRLLAEMTRRPNGLPQPGPGKKPRGKRRAVR